jgi:hypothetical protein
MVYMQNEVLFSHEEEQNYDICKTMNGTRDYHIKWNKPDSERQTLHFFLMWRI